jgi:hypothetical protein
MTTLRKQVTDNATRGALKLADAAAALKAAAHDLLHITAVGPRSTTTNSCSTPPRNPDVVMRSA